MGEWVGERGARYYLHNIAYCYQALLLYESHTHTHTGTRARTHTQTHTRARARAHTRIHTRIHTWTHTHTHTYVYTHSRTHARTRIHTRIYTWTHTHAHTYYVHAPARARMYALDVQFVSMYSVIPYAGGVLAMSGACWCSLGTSSGTQCRDVTQLPSDDVLCCLASWRLLLRFGINAS